MVCVFGAIGLLQWGCALRLGDGCEMMPTHQATQVTDVVNARTATANLRPNGLDLT